jgi:hypothetical protein
MAKIRRLVKRLPGPAAGDSASQARFMAKRVAGLWHDATRPGRKKPLPAATIEQVVAMTLAGPPGEATHWTGRAMA